MISIIESSSRSEKSGLHLLSRSKREQVMKSMGRIIISSTLITLFLLSGVSSIASAQLGTVGIVGGNWFMYGNITASWNSTDPNAQPPAIVEAYGQMQWIILNFTDVVGTTVLGQFTFHFKNGNETSQPGGSIDVDTGDGPLNGWLISANLQSGDPVYNSSILIINETITKSYPSGVRDTNHVRTIIPYNATGYSYSQDYYWDRSTGVLLENFFEDSNHTGTYVENSSFYVQLTGSNVWLVPEFPIWTATVLVFVTITFVVLNIRVRSERRRQRLTLA